MAKVEQGPEGSQGLQGRGPKCEFEVVVWGGIAGGRGSQPVLIDVARGVVWLWKASIHGGLAASRPCAGGCGYVGGLRQGWGGLRYCGGWAPSVMGVVI